MPLDEEVVLVLVVVIVVASPSGTCKAVTLERVRRSRERCAVDVVGGGGGGDVVLSSYKIGDIAS